VDRTEQPEIGTVVKAVLLFAAVLVLPGMGWSFLGWSQIFLPLFSFFLCGRFGAHTGFRMLVSATALALLVYIVLGRLELFLISLVMLSSGYVLFLSATRCDSPALSGLKAAMTLAGGWILAMIIMSVGSEVSVYDQLLKMLDQSFVDAVEYYRRSDSVSSETHVMLENTLYQMKALAPLILPAVLGGMILMITWLTMVLGNTHPLKILGNFAWISYKNWQLPEKLIWLVILMGILTLLPTTLRAVGVNSLILLGLVYCFQGLSVLVFFMNKWNVPILLRSLFYVMIVFQSLGTLLLLFIGIADTWLDFRKQKPATTGHIA
jgi:uncharacterized protein YybS (DUF2232 family)